MRALCLLSLLLLTACPSGKTDDTSGAAGDVDADGDGYVSLEDCDDGDAAVNPGAEERCNGVDDDCDGYVDSDDPGLSEGELHYRDRDDDGWGGLASSDERRFCDEAPEGWVAEAGDCDDEDPAIHPGADELCNEVDDDCDGAIDEAGALDGTWYLDADGDGFGDEGSAIYQCEEPEGAIAIGGDCDDEDPAIHPGAEERCDGIDNDCDGAIDEDDAVDASTWYLDADGDGFGDPASTTTACGEPSGYADDSSDCDDGDAAVFPGADELCNGVDDDCDGLVDPDSALDAPTWYEDADEDGYGDAASATAACSEPRGYTADNSDCDDTHAGSHPGADEHCDGLDNDCDGDVDEEVVDGATWYADADGDGYGDAAAPTTTATCDQPVGYVGTDNDCDDGDAAVSPAADELCDGIDNDCDGDVDEDSAVDAPTWYADADGDSHGDPLVTTAACAEPGGHTADSSDCDDGDASVNPAADELCDGVDNDCDGATDEDSAVDASTWYADADGDGFGDPDVTAAACREPAGHTGDATDCDDGDASVNPAGTELCDGVDNDCDGVVDPDSAADAATWYADADGDGYGTSAGTATACSEPSGYAATASDCDDADPAVSPGADELCDGIDNDCDGAVDENSAVDAGTWYTDGDGDGYGDDASAFTSCTQPARTVAQGGDCDDGDGMVNPGGMELCDGLDNDCDGTVDQGAIDASTWYDDADSDTYGDPDAPRVECTQPPGTVTNDLDCNDVHPGVHPGATEACDGIDNDCDGSVDEPGATGGGTWYRDQDGDGFGRSSISTTSCSQPSGYVDNAEDCDDADGTINPDADEICDGIDNDCDGLVDDDDDDVQGVSTWYTDGDGDGYGGTAGATGCAPPSGGAELGGDCDDSDAAVHPGATELCDGVDNDCDGAVDGSGLATWFPSGISSSAGATDLSTTLGSGTSSSAYHYDIVTSGTLALCPGTWYLNLDLHGGDITLLGPQGSASTIVDGTGSRAVVYVNSTVSSVTAQGLTLQDGSGGYGGGVAGNVHGAELILDDLVVRDCYANYGGGIYLQNGSVTATDLVVSENVAGTNGGGLYLYSATVDIEGLEALDNQASSYAGGAYLRSCSSTVSDALISGNEAYYAAGVEVYYGTLELQDSEVVGNVAYYGGGVYVTWGDAELSGCQIHDNDAYYYGGGLFLNNGADVLCSGSTSTSAGVWDNYGYHGGGAYHYDHDSELISDLCDWGTGSLDNEYHDVELDNSYYSYDYGDDADFTCRNTGCW